MGEGISPAEVLLQCSKIRLGLTTSGMALRDAVRHSGDGRYGSHQVEVGSPSDRLRDIEEKISDYRNAGVQLIWYSFPETQTVWVDGANRTRVTLTVDDVLDASDILPGIAPIPIAEIFQ
jgi:hypothetical protein